jgi:hypothetical protein
MRDAMSDIVMLVLTGGFFGIAIWYALACDHL